MKSAQVGTVVLAIALTSGPARAVSELVYEKVAQVNGRTLTASEVFGPISDEIDRIRESGDRRAEDLVYRLKLQALKGRIEQLLIYDDAMSRLGDPQREQLQAIARQNLERLAARAGSMEKLKEQLKQAGSSFEREIEREKERLLLADVMEREINQRIVISPSEMVSYFQEHREEFASVKEVQIREILIPFREYGTRDEALEAANRVLQKIKSGADFAQLARDYSKGPHAAEGGLYDYVRRGGLRYKQVEDVAFALSVGEVSPIFETEVGYHIVKLEAVNEAKDPDFEEAQDEIRAVITKRRRAQLFREMVERLEKHSSVKITWRDYVVRETRR